MKKLKGLTKIFSALAAVFLAVFFLFTGVSAKSFDDAGNAVETRGNNRSVEVDGDYYFFYTSGSSVNDTISGSIGGDLIAAGGYLELKELTVGGNVRTASMYLRIEDTTAKNATVFAYTIEIGENSSFGAVYAAGSSIVFRGDCDYLELRATNVYIYGTVRKSAKIYADNVYFVDTAEVNNVTVEGERVPFYFKDGSAQPSGTYTEVEGLDSAIDYIKTPGQLQRSFANLRYTIPAGILLMLLLFLAMDKALDRAGERLKCRPGSTIGFGFLGAFIIPFLVLILIILQCSATVGLVLALAYILIAIIANIFTAASLARILLPSLNKHLSSLIGVTVAAILSVFTGFNGLFTIFSMIYTFGFILGSLLIKKQNPPAENMERYEV